MLGLKSEGQFGYFAEVSTAFCHAADSFISSFDFWALKHTIILIRCHVLNYVAVIVKDHPNPTLRYNPDGKTNIKDVCITGDFLMKDDLKGELVTILQ